MTETSTTDRARWVGKLDQLTSDHEGDTLVLEVLDRSYGEQAGRVPFGYASDDPATTPSSSVWAGGRCLLSVASLHA